MPNDGWFHRDSESGGARSSLGAAGAGDFLSRRKFVTEGIVEQTLPGELAAVKEAFAWPIFSGR